MMLPIGIVMNAIGPNRIPWIGPRIGPVPAMLSKLMRLFFQPRIGT